MDCIVVLSFYNFLTPCTLHFSRRPLTDACVWCSSYIFLNCGNHPVLQRCVLIVEVEVLLIIGRADHSQGKCPYLVPGCWYYYFSFCLFVACFSLSNFMAHCSFKQPSFVNGCNIKTILRFSSFESVSCDVTCPWPRGFTFTPWHCHGFLSFEAACESSHLHKCRQSAGKHAYLQGKLWPYRLRRDWTML